MDRVIKSREPSDDRSAADDERSAPAALDGFIAYHLRLAQTASFRAFSARTGQADLKPGWYAVMSIIGEHPDIAPAALSRAAGKDKSTLTPVLRDLLRQELVERRANEGDRRSYRLRLTARGRDYLSELAAHAAAHDAALDRIAGTMKPRLIRILKRIAEEMG